MRMTNDELEQSTAVCTLESRLVGAGERNKARTAVEYHRAGKSADWIISRLFDISDEKIALAERSELRLNDGSMASAKMLTAEKLRNLKRTHLKWLEKVLNNAS
jgi:hypothetical protein